MKGSLFSERVAIAVAGAVGCALGAALHESGAAEVTLVARGEHLRVLRDHGLTVTDGRGERVVKLAAEDRLRERPDLLILAMKTQDLEQGAKACAEVAQGAPAIALQNGLAPEVLAARHLGNGVLGAVSDVIVDFLEPGRIEVGKIRGLVLGRPGAAADESVREAATLFHRAGVPARATDNLAGARWLKLLVNLNNALPAATGRSVQELYELPHVAGLAARMMREGIRVAQAEGVTLEAIPTATPRLVRLVATLPVPLAAAVLRRRVRNVSARPILGSTLQSLRRGKTTTEIAWLNGEVVARGRTHGLPTPVNEVLVDAVHRVEKGAPFAQPRDLLAAASAALGRRG